MSPDPIGPADATQVPRYAGPATFARLPRIDEVARADVAILGVPFDCGVSYRPGARFGPGHIRKSSKLLRPYNPAQDVHAVRRRSRWPTPATSRVQPVRHRRGDRRRSTPRSRDVLPTGRHVLTLGGDHTIALPILRALRGDARAGRGAALRRAPGHLGHLLRRAVHPRHPVPPGQRGGAARPGALPCTWGSAARSTPRRISRTTPALGFPIVRADDYETTASTARSSGCGAGSATRPVYVSIDIDVLDPAHAPGTGTPEAGGLTSRELLDTLRGAGRAEHRRRRRRRGGPGLRPRRDHRHRRRARGLRADLRHDAAPAGRPGGRERARRAGVVASPR